MKETFSSEKVCPVRSGTELDGTDVKMGLFSIAETVSTAETLFLIAGTFYGTLRYLG